MSVEDRIKHKCAGFKQSGELFTINNQHIGCAGPLWAIGTETNSQKYI